MERLTQKHGKNNLFILNIAHSFEHFLQTCDFLKLLPGSLTQFTGMMASIIQDVYNIDMDALKKASREMKADLVEKERRMELVLKGRKGDLDICEEEAGPSMRVEEDQLEPILSREELKAVMREVHLKSVHEKEVKEDVYYEARAGSILERTGGEAPVTPEMKLAFVQVMKQDEWQFHLGKLRLKDKKKPSCKEARGE